MKPNPLQLELLRAVVRHQLICVQAGWGSGKTSACSMAVISHAMMTPGGASLFVTDTAVRYRTVVHPSLTEWTEKLTGRAWEYNQLEQKWTAPNGHIIWCRAYFRPGTKTASQNSLEGINAGFALIDEAQVFSEEVFFKTMGRIRSAGSIGPRLIVVGLPVYGSWWMKLCHESGGYPIEATSYANKENLSEDWYRMARDTLPRAEYEAMVMNRPQPPTGLVLNTFSPESHIIDNWQYDQSMSTALALDWGFRRPAALFISHDPSLNDGDGANVIHAELAPSEVTVNQLTKQILRISWPRIHAASAPKDGMILIDEASCDKAGAARSDQTAISAVRAMSREPPPNGLGIGFRLTTDPLRVDVMNSLQRMRMLFERDQFYISRELWDSGLSTKQHSLSRGLMSYAWDGQGRPIKNNLEHHIDALRYHIINFMWRDNPITTRSKSVPNIDRRKLKKMDDRF